MGFINKTWTDPVNLDASNINRIEHGIKNSHDNLEILNEEVSNLQSKRIAIEAEIAKLIQKDSDVLQELTKISSSNIPFNPLNYLSTLEQSLTTEELKQVYSNLKLNNFLKLTDVRINGNSIVTDSVLNIPMPTIDTALNITSTNAISNKAVALAIQDVSLNKNIPVYLAELLQDNNHMTVSREEKVKWNSLEDLIKDISIEESDPTVPAWAKEPVKPFYIYTEILGAPTKLSYFTNDTNFITNAYVDSELTKLKNILLGPDGDAALDTITELASAIADNSDIINTLNQAITNKANTTELSSVTNATLSSDSKTLTITKRDGTSFDFQGGSDLSNYVTKDGFTMRASTTVGEFYYNTGAGEKSISVTMPTIPTTIDGMSGGTLTSPLVITGGDTATASKIILNETNKGQITASGAQTLLGFNTTGQLDIGHSSFNLRLRGKEARPKYVNKDMALYEDIPTSIDGLAGGNFTSAIGVNNNAAQMTNAGYVIGTWLQSTNATDIGGSNWPDVWVHHNGWLYKRNKTAFINDLGVLKLDGTNTMTGKLNLKATGAEDTNIGDNGIRWNASSLPQDTAPQFICTIDAFAAGGRQMWASVGDLKTQMQIHKLGTTNWSVTQDSSGSLVFRYS